MSWPVDKLNKILIQPWQLSTEHLTKLVSKDQEEKSKLKIIPIYKPYLQLSFMLNPTICKLPAEMNHL
jgi:hypothetical protein